MDKNNYDPVYEAYKILVSIFENENLDEGVALIAVGEAIGYLGEALA